MEVENVSKLGYGKSEFANGKVDFQLQLKDKRYGQAEQRGS